MVSVTQFNSKDMPTNTTDNTCHLKAIELAIFGDITVHVVLFKCENVCDIDTALPNIARW